MKKLLIIVDHLMQHGVERYTYELCKAIDKNEFSVTVLSLNKLTTEINYYGPLLENIGIKVIDYDRQSGFSRIFKINIPNRILFKLSFLFKYIFNTDIISFIQGKNLVKILDKFDVLAIMKIENFNSNSCIFAKYKNSVVHFLSVPAQYGTNPYTLLADTENINNFVIMTDDQKNQFLSAMKNEEIKKRNLNFLKMPLVIDINGRENIYIQNNISNPVIAIFSRISLDQPTIIMLVSFSILLKKLPDAQLLFFGAAYDQNIKDFFLLNCNILGIQNNVKFMGHVRNLEDAIRDNYINLAWMNISGPTMGYSSIEILSYGLPTVFFNVQINFEEITDFRIDNKIFSFKDIEQFVNRSVELLTNQEERQNTSETLYNYIHKICNLDMEEIRELEQFYKQVCK